MGLAVPPPQSEIPLQTAASPSPSVLAPGSAETAAGQARLATLARDLYDVLVALQARRRHRSAEATAASAERLDSVAVQARQMAAELAGPEARLADTLQRLAAGCDAVRAMVVAGQALRGSKPMHLAQHYEALAQVLRADPALAATLPELKPPNYVRNGFHIANSIMSATLYTVWPTRSTMLWIACLYTGAMVTLEIVRRLDPRINSFLVDVVFGAIARPVEAHRINSATWYGAAIIVIVFFFPPVACITGVLVLGFGDPVAALVGRRWGRIRLRGRKTLEGTLGFVAAAAIAATSFLALTGHPAVVGASFGATVAHAFGLSLAAAIAGAAIELGSDRIEDNFSIPVVVAAVVAALV